MPLTSKLTLPGWRIIQISSWFLALQLFKACSHYAVILGLTKLPWYFWIWATTLHRHESMSHKFVAATLNGVKFYSKGGEKTKPNLKHSWRLLWLHVMNTFSYWFLAWYATPPSGAILFLWSYGQLPVVITTFFHPRKGCLAGNNHGIARSFCFFWDLSFSYFPSWVLLRTSIHCTYEVPHVQHTCNGQNS